MRRMLGCARAERAVEREHSLDGSNGGLGAALFPHDDLHGGRALQKARVVEQRAQLARDALCAVFVGQQLPRNAELAHAARVVELIVAVWHEQSRLTAAQRLRRRAGTALMNDDACAREQELMRRAVDE